jgi:hypothetical protein
MDSALRTYNSSNFLIGISLDLADGAIELFTAKVELI